MISRYLFYQKTFIIRVINGLLVLLIRVIRNDNAMQGCKNKVRDPGPCWMHGRRIFELRKKMICDDCKYRNQDESAWPCKNCTPDDRRYEAETDHEMLRRLELARLRQQLAATRQALVQYGAHDGACSVVDLDDEGRHCACDCGYEAAIKAAKFDAPC